MWYREAIKDTESGAVDEMVVSVEADLTRSVLASHGGAGSDWLESQWVRVHRAGDSGDEDCVRVFERVLCVSGDDVYVIEHGTGELDIRGRIELNGAVVDEEVVLGDADDRE